MPSLSCDNSPRNIALLGQLHHLRTSRRPWIVASRNRGDDRGAIRRGKLCHLRNGILRSRASSRLTYCLRISGFGVRCTRDR